VDLGTGACPKLPLRAPACVKDLKGAAAARDAAEATGRLIRVAQPHDRSSRDANGLYRRGAKDAGGHVGHQVPEAVDDRAPYQRGAVLHFVVPHTGPPNGWPGHAV